MTLSSNGKYKENHQIHHYHQQFHIPLVAFPISSPSSLMKSQAMNTELPIATIKQMHS